MFAKAINPILNVSDMQQSFAWFEKLGWQKLWDWGDPPTFGAVGSGECEIFLCLDGQGGRGKSDIVVKERFPGSAGNGVWMSIWVDDVDAIHKRCLEQNIEVTFPPQDMPWNVREFHVRHPDGHVFRISRGTRRGRGGRTMNVLLRKLRGVMGVGLTWGVMWAAIGGATGLVMRVTVPGSVDQAKTSSSSAQW